MKLKDVVKNNNYPNIECRVICTLPNGKERDILFGFCSYVDGILESGDCDSYSLEDIVDKYLYDEKEDVLYVWQNTKIMTAEEYDEYLEEQKNDNGKRM